MLLIMVKTKTCRARFLTHFVNRFIYAPAASTASPIRELWVAAWASSLISCPAAVSCCSSSWVVWAIMSSYLAAFSSRASFSRSSAASRAWASIWSRSAPSSPLLHCSPKRFASSAACRSFSSISVSWARMGDRSCSALFSFSSRDTIFFLVSCSCFSSWLLSSAVEMTTSPSFAILSASPFLQQLLFLAGVFLPQVHKLPVSAVPVPVGLI